MAKNFKKVAFTVYPIKDMARARAFYEEVLGLETGENFGGDWQEYDFGGTTFAVSTMIAEFIKPGSQGSVAFEVHNLKELVKTLQAKRVEFSGELMETPVCWMAFVKDPDGNSITLHQAKE